MVRIASELFEFDRMLSQEEVENTDDVICFMPGDVENKGFPYFSAAPVGKYKGNALSYRCVDFQYEHEIICVSMQTTLRTAYS